jgi:hypothetical protein
MGIWMDHSNAHLIEFTPDPMMTTVISSSHEQKDYYKRIVEIIKNSRYVLLFGPNAAKIELYNLLSVDQHFEKTKIETKDADKMTENEQHSFVRKHFSRFTTSL